MSSSEDSGTSFTDYEYEIEAENDVDLDVSPPTSDDEATAFTDDPLADPEWRYQCEKEMEKEKERLQGIKVPMKYKLFFAYLKGL